MVSTFSSASTSSRTHYCCVYMHMYSYIWMCIIHIDVRLHLQDVRSMRVFYLHLHRHPHFHVHVIITSTVHLQTQVARDETIYQTQEMRQSIKHKSHNVSHLATPLPSLSHASSSPPSPPCPPSAQRHECLYTRVCIRENLVPPPVLRRRIGIPPPLPPFCHPPSWEDWRECWRRGGRRVWMIWLL